MHNRDKRERYEELPVTDVNDGTNTPPAKRQKTDEMDLGYNLGQDAQEFNYEGDSDIHNQHITEMMTAAFYGNVENFKMLQEFTENWWMYVDNYGRNMLHLAALSQDGGVMIGHIISSLSPEINASLLEAKSSDGLTPVMHAALCGYTETFNELANHTPNWEDHRTSQGDNILHLAAQNQNSDLMFKQLVERLGQEKYRQLGQERSISGEIPAEILERRGFENFLQLCHKGNAGRVRELFKSSTYSQRQKAIAYNNFQSLFVAISSSSKEMINLLLKATSKRLLREFLNNPEFVTALVELIKPTDFETLNFFATLSPQEFINKFFIKNPDSIGAGLSFFLKMTNSEVIKSILQLLANNNSIDPTLITEILNNKASSILRQAVNAKNSDLIITLIQAYPSPEAIKYESFANDLNLAANDGYADLIKLFSDIFPKDVYVKILEKSNLNSFHIAVTYGKTEFVKLLIETSTDELREQLFEIKYVQSFKLAAKKGYSEMLELFLAYCPDNLRDQILQMHELFIFSQGCINGHVAALEAFFQKYPLAQIEKIMAEREFADFIVAAKEGHTQVVSFFLEHCSDEAINNMLKASDECGNSALILAAENGHLEVVKLLLEGRSEGQVEYMLLAENSDQYTALMEASSKGHLEVVKFLLQGRSVKLVNDMLAPTNEYRQSCLFLAASGGHVEVVKFLLQGRSKEQIKEMLLAHDNDDQTALILAASGGHVEVVKFLLQGRSDKLVKKMLFANAFEANNALVLAASNGHLEVVKVLLQDRSVELVREMLTAPSTYGGTVLMKASSRGNLEVVKLLLEGCSVELVKEMLTATDNAGFNSLMLATWQNEAEMVKMLVERCPQEILAPMVRGNNFMYLRTALENEFLNRFITVECLLGIIEEKFTVDGANPMLGEAVAALNGTPYGDMNYVMSIIAQRKEMKRQNPTCNIDEFNEHTLKLSKNANLAKLLLTCTNFPASVANSALQLSDVVLSIVDEIAEFKTSKLVINAQLLSIQSVMLSAEYDLKPGSIEFCYKVRHKYNCLEGDQKKSQSEGFSLSM